MHLLYDFHTLNPVAEDRRQFNTLALSLNGLGKFLCLLIYIHVCKWAQLSPLCRELNGIGLLQERWMGYFNILYCCYYFNVYVWFVECMSCECNV